MLNIKLSDNEKRLIKEWADEALHGGHWGDGDVETIDEAVTLNELNSGSEDLRLAPMMVRLILIWADNSCVQTAATPEEGQLLSKLKAALDHHYKEEI